jgi:hypothetical protein
MEIIIYEEGTQKIAEVVSDAVVIGNEQDALDLMVDPRLEGARKIIIDKNCLSPDFFDLSTRVAGDVLQKFVNYRMKLAIVGDFENTGGETLQAFIRESNRGNEIFFVDDIESAKNRLFNA